MKKKSYETLEEATKEKFDKTIPLNEPYHLLNEKEFEGVDKFVQPHVDAMYVSLLNPESTPS